MKNLELKCDEFKDYIIKINERNRLSSKGVQYIFKFENGYGASVIKHRGSYGYEKDLWELGVLDSDGELDYNTPITDYVIGYLTDEQVCELLQRIKNLET